MTPGNDSVGRERVSFVSWLLLAFRASRVQVVKVKTSQSAVRMGKVKSWNSEKLKRYTVTRGEKRTG